MHKTDVIVYEITGLVTSYNSRHGKIIVALSKTEYTSS